MRRLFVSNYYCSIFLLCAHEIQSFNDLFEDDVELQNTIQHCAEFWTATLRREYPDHIVCRQRFIMRTLIRTAKSHRETEMTPSLCRAISFAMADLVERRVGELDAEHSKSLRN